LGGACSSFRFAANLQKSTNPPLMNGVAAARPNRGHGFWRVALSGLTPQVVAIVCALLAFRIIGTSGDQILLALNDKHGQWLLEPLVGFCSLLMMVTPMLVIIIATGNLGPQRGAQRIAALAVAVIVSAGIGTLLRIAFAYLRTGSDVSDMLHYVWPRYALLGGMLTLVRELARREATSIEAMQRAEIDRADFEREMAEARLQMLRAQIEPHFLFNTLANVRRLYDKERSAGATMLENLMRYLEIALPRIRQNETTLGRDAELVEAFLRIQQIRMGRRLIFNIDIPQHLRTHPVPPMMLLTLVENAIKHGLTPSPDGGLLRINARYDANRLVLSVADTGVGFAPGSGAGTGLSNIRARLSAQFGGHASLALENNELGGVTATVALPLAAG
jgi:sensor histidine kinase YesM